MAKGVQESRGRLAFSSNKVMLQLVDDFGKTDYT